MTHTQATLQVKKKKKACPAEVGTLASVFEKSATELKLKQKLLKCKCTIQIVTFNFRTLNRIGQLLELTILVIDHNIDIICIKEYRYTHSENIKYHYTGNGWTLATASAWKNSVNATIGGIGMCDNTRFCSLHKLLSPRLNTYVGWIKARSRFT